MNNRITLEQVMATNKQIEQLYHLLSKRQYSISHEKTPTIAEHTRFVKQHPYRVWYLIFIKQKLCGSIYAQFDNSVGINNVDEVSAEDIALIIEKFNALVTPLEPIPSVRYKDFFFNVSSHNQSLQNKFMQIGYQASQVSFVKKE